MILTQREIGDDRCDGSTSGAAILDVAGGTRGAGATIQRCSDPILAADGRAHAAVAAWGTEASEKLFLSSAYPVLSRVARESADDAKHP